MLWNDNKIYVWMQFSRVSGKVGKCDFFAHPNSDAKATGQFNDSITRVGFATVYPGQTKDEVFNLYREQAIEDAQQRGFTNNKVVPIRRRDYQAFLRSELIDAEEFLGAYYAPAYQGKRMVRK
jgi:hypothetical protein